ncbi:unnamed protein product [Caenorhabditis nigoni]
MRVARKTTETQITSANCPIRELLDCTGTFSAGSWMGIISALVLIGGLIFGYVMLQSVQTMDRFDDPKQKQIVINVRE